MFKYYCLKVYNKLTSTILENFYIKKIIFSYTKAKSLLNTCRYKSNKRYVKFHINNNRLKKDRKWILTAFWFVSAERQCVNFIKALLDFKVTILYLQIAVRIVIYYITIKHVMTNINISNVISIYIYIYILLILITICYSTYVVFYNVNNYIHAYMTAYYILFIISIYIQFISFYNTYNIVVYLDFKQFINNEYLYFFSFTINNINMLFITTTIQISFFTNIYVFFYMKTDQSFNRFFILLNLFSFSMVFLLHSNTVIMLFFFWECIGGVSFFLINYFFYKPIVFKSSFKAFMYNRISDVFLLTAIIIYYSSTNSILIDKHSMYLFINNTSNVYILNNKINTIDLFVIFLTIAAFVKSAQFPLHFWLPDSMEAPVPASALIHSATLVAAGIFLFFKFNTIIYNSSYSNCIIIINAITMLLSSITACTQTDVKKLLAYSTISNCSVMFISFFLSNDINTLLYFITHGWSKSLSFFIVGILVILYHHNQDSRVMSSNIYLYIIILNIIIVSILTLSAWFFLTNSFIKHSITGNIYTPILTKAIIMFSVVFSYAYSIKLILLIFQNYSVVCKYRYVVINTYVVYTIYIYLLIVTVLPYVYKSYVVSILHSDLFNTISYVLLLVLLLITLTTQNKYNKNNYIILTIFLLFLL